MYTYLYKNSRTYDLYQFLLIMTGFVRFLFNYDMCTNTSLEFFCLVNDHCMFASNKDNVYFANLFTRSWPSV